MKNLRPYSLIFFVVISLILIFVIKALIPGHFHSNAYKLAEPSFNQSNVIGRQALQSLHKPLIISLDKNVAQDGIYIPADRLSDKKNLRIIRHHKGAVVLSANDASVTAKAWMLLSQMGYSNVYILMDDINNEALRYKFRPDTSQAGVSE